MSDGSLSQEEIDALLQGADDLGSIVEQPVPETAPAQAGLTDDEKNELDVALVISNDSDLAEAIRIRKTELGKRIILANPFLWSKKNIAKGLTKLNLEKRTIRKKQLRKCQLPTTIPNSNIFKPESW